MAATNNDSIQFAVNNLLITNYQPKRYLNITLNGTYLIVNTGRPCVLRGVFVNTAGTVGNSIQIYDGNSTSGVKIGKLDGMIIQEKYYNTLCNSGILIVVSGATAGDITITYDI